MSAKNSFMAFLGGAAVGAVVALLFAPEKGEVTRRKIGKAVNDGRDKLADLYETGKEKMIDTYEQNRDKVVDAYHKGRERLAEAISEGREMMDEELETICQSVGKEKEKSK